MLSIKNQTDKDYKAIVVYDGLNIKNDQLFDDKISFFNIDKTSKGAGPVRNAAIPFIETEWTAFVDDDDIISESYLKNLRYFSSIFPEADLIIFRSIRFHNQKYLIVPHLRTEDTLELGNVGIYFAVKTHILKEVQFNDMRAEDFDFIQRCNQSGYCIWLNRHINYFVRIQPTQEDLEIYRKKEKELFPKKILLLNTTPTWTDVTANDSPFVLNVS